MNHELNNRSLVLKSFHHHARSHLGTLLGAAVGSAVLVGALIVGDSVRGSLQDMANARIGKVELALASNDRLFRAALAGQLGSELNAPAAAALQLTGVARLPDGSARANRIQVLGVSTNFWALALDKPNLGTIPEDSVVLNKRLARQLNVRVGDAVNLRVHNPSLLSRDAPLSPTEDVSASMAQLEVRAIVTDKQFGRFSLQSGQVSLFSAFVNLAQLQGEIDKPSLANLILVGAGNGENAPTVETATAALEKHWILADTQAQLLQVPGGMELRSPRVFLDPPLAAAALKAEVEAHGVLTYFVNSIRLGDRATPYSMVSAVDPPIIPEGAGDATLYLNQWTAADLGAKPDDEVELTYFVVGTMRKLEEKSGRFRVGKILPMSGLSADRTLMPDFPGMTDSEDCKDWDTGFPIDLDAIREKDEDYWDRHRGTPKAFISLAKGREIWSNRFGNLTAVRYPGKTVSDRESLTDAVLKNLRPGAAGLEFQAVRTRTQASVDNSMDFGLLFLASSFFLIAAAVMLISLLFQFTLEKRTQETGTLLAIGLPVKQVSKLLLMEGLLIAFFGGVIGMAGGAAYAVLMLKGLSSIWSEAVSSAMLEYHQSSVTLLVGALSGILIAWMTIWLTLRKQTRKPARALLSGEAETDPTDIKKNRRSWILGGLFLLVALGLAASLAISEPGLTPEHFFGVGSLLLVAGIFGFSGFLGGLARGQALTTSPGLIALGLRNAARRRRRSLSIVGMLACGSFMIASMGVFEKNANANADQHGSGTGGFDLLGEASMAIVHDLSDATQRADQFNLDDPELEDMSLTAFRLREGDEASCLNLNQAQKPRILGVNPESLAGRFTFKKMLDGFEHENDWMVLRADEQLGFAENEIPAVADENVIAYALRKKLGDTIPFTDERGKVIHLKLAGSVANSLLQGSLLISEEHFIRHFPGESGYRMFLINTGHPTPVSGILSMALADHGMEIVRAPDRLGEFNAVQNTYLGTFQILGGLGLLLGSVGLGVVVMRNVHERRQELALLRAIGFQRREIKRFVLSEYMGLLTVGLLVGTMAAFVAVLPAVLSPGAEVPYTPLALTLGGVLVSGAIWTWLAAQWSLKGRLLDALENN